MKKQIVFSSMITVMALALPLSVQAAVVDPAVTSAGGTIAVGAPTTSAPKADQAQLPVAVQMSAAQPVRVEHQHQPDRHQIEHQYEHQGVEHPEMEHQSGAEIEHPEIDHQAMTEIERPEIEHHELNQEIPEVNRPEMEHQGGQHD